MRKVPFVLLATLSFGMLLFLGCLKENPIIPEKHTTYPGMRLIKAKGDSVSMGSSGESAQIDEKPVSGARFTYDFSIDTTEVTVGMYRNVIRSIPAEFDTLSEIKDDYPICYVSWYDAVLFCNARSNIEHLDTVYSYIAVEKTFSGDIFRFSGLRTDFSKNGYRLPTEAEWIYAARGHGGNEYLWGDDPSPDSTTRYCWYTGNANHTPLAVATRTPNSNHLYDLSGNVSEWVNESKIPFSGTTITNFVGSNDPAHTAKIVKGGSANHDITYLRISCRSDVYQVDAASRNRYTGFRCAAGSIDNPTYLSNDNHVINLEPVMPTNTATLPFLGTNNAVLAFVNFSGSAQRTLCFIDYRRQPATLYQFTDRTNVFTPAISPDGNWIAWSDRDEGVAAGGSVFVRQVLPDDTTIIALPDTPAFIPRWHIDPSTTDTFVLYVTSAQLNDQVAWRSTQTRRMRFTNGGFLGNPEVIETNGAYHGGQSTDGTYLATGYPLLKMKNLTSGVEKTLFYAPLDGKKGSDTSQVCNVSISPGVLTPDRMLFLDFGSGRDTSSLTGTVYHAHEYLFTGEFNGTIVNWYQIPAPYYSWNHTEYSNLDNYAIATAATSNGAHRTIFCVNLLTHALTPMCEGTDLYYPSLWIKPGTNIISTRYDLDSLGQYDSPHLSGQQAQLSFKMHSFWNLADSLDVIFVGSSVAADDINPRHFTNLRGYNIAIGGGDLALTVELIRNYVLNHCPHLKIIGLSYDPHLFFLEGGAGEAYTTFTQGKGFVYDKNHVFWSSGVTEEFHSLIKSVTPPAVPDSIDSLGHILFGCAGYGPVPPPILGDTTVTTESPMYRENMNMLLETIRLCTLKNIKVLLVNFPTHPGYAATAAYGPLGPSRSTAQTMLSEIKAEAEKNSSFTFYDACKDGAHDYTEFEFYDYLHLCSEGAKKMSTRVDSIFHSMLNE